MWVRVRVVVRVRVRGSPCAHALSDAAGTADGAPRGTPG